MFTSTDLPITGGVAINSDTAGSKTKLQLYELDGIQRIEADLSKGLTTNPQKSKRIVLQRIQQLDEVVIYGMTDIRAALRQYQQWREGGKQ